MKAQHLPTLAIACMVFGIVRLTASPSTAKPPAIPRPNVLIIMTDQQRFDALSCAGNPVLNTPNLDRLAREGTRFSKFYTACPVCVPARTTLLTGHDPESNHVRSNPEVNTADMPDFPSFDQVLLRNGYKGEYHGKWHSPYKLALDYTRPVRWLNGPKPPGCKADMSEAQAYNRYVLAHTSGVKTQPGELTQRNRIWRYTPVPLDENFGNSGALPHGEAESYGRLELPAAYTLTAYTSQEGLEALDRLKDGPFTLTISIGPPHPPMLVAEPYYSMYPPSSIPVPPSIGDSRANSPYRTSSRGPRDPAYRKPENIQQMTSIYYGMIAEVDHWVGRILHRLDELGLSQNTLVIFTSDHGEELGEHGMHGKFVFYEGSVHVPLIMRLPGVIPAGKVVNVPATHIDLFSTILDYCDQPEHPSNGHSLRPLIEGRPDNIQRIAVSEWPSTRLPGFMVFDGRWKFLFGRTAEASSLDALYDLQVDPHELNNLIGRNPAREQSRAEAEHMKKLLVEWLKGINSPLWSSVAARPAITEPAVDETARPRERL